ncbi:unnamed protein product [marine sediment metagenome]|uniref:Uncharacterized protein n=1 Tax=marine sediment metagenome TaxID=412755 RepID=X1T6X5_9ZZZZ
MTPNTVPRILDAILDPLASIQEQVQAALDLARQNKLPRPFLDTIQGAVANLDITWEALNEIATTLDPDRGQPEP